MAYTLAEYEAQIGALGPLYYWPMTESSGTSFAEANGGPALVSNVALSRITGPFSGSVAPEFNGTSDYASVALSLSAYPALAVSFWLNWYSFANNDKLALEYTANYNSNNGFIVDPNSTAGGLSAMQFGMHGTAGINDGTAARTGQSAWTLYTVKFDRDSSYGGNRTEIWRNQGTTGGTKINSANVANTWDNSTLYAMSRAGASLFGWGALAHLAIFPYEWSLPQQQAIAGVSPYVTNAQFQQFQADLSALIGYVAQTYQNAP